MYKIVKHFFLAGVLVGFLLSCGDMEDTHRDVIKDNVTVEVEVEVDCDTETEDQNTDKEDKKVAKGG